MYLDNYFLRISENSISENSGVVLKTRAVTYQETLTVRGLSDTLTLKPAVLQICTGFSSKKQM